MSLIDLSGNLLFVAFVAYLIATLLFGGAVKGGSKDESADAGKNGVH